jgi:N-acetylmuramoyl-L-alanine amidase
MPSLFEQLVARYAEIPIAFPTLKPVTIAQWILESGRGTSNLARDHLNFAGLKWRSEMVGFATPVRYDASAGLDFYCKFATLDDFILGFWRFLARSPYEVWEDHAKSPDDFIGFIGPIYNPSGQAYVDQVKSLVPEATKLLAAAAGTAPVPIPVPAGTAKVIVIDPGHGGTAIVGGSSPNNAMCPNGELEKTWTLEFAKRTQTAVLTKALAAGKNIKVILTRDKDVNIGLSARANVARVNRASLFLSIHFNGFNGVVRRVETLIGTSNFNPAEDQKFALLVQTKVFNAIAKMDPSTKNGGVKAQSLGALNDIALGNAAASHPCRACMIEVEFMDTVAVCNLFSINPAGAAAVAANAARRQQVADALAEALIDAL